MSLSVPKESHSLIILVVATHSSTPVVARPERINHIDALSNAGGAFALPPLLALFCKGGFVVTVDQTSTTAFIADDDDHLANPSRDVLDMLAVVAGQGLLDVHDVGREVAHEVHESGLGAEGHDGALLLHNGLGLGVKGVEEGCPAAVVVAALGRVGRGQLTGRHGLLGSNVRVGRRDRQGAVGRGSLLDGVFQTGSIDQDKDANVIRVDMVGKMREKRLGYH